MLEAGRDYPYNMWRTYKEETGFLRSSYDSFRVYVWHLKNAGLIEKVQTTRKKGSPIKRNYYSVTEKGVNSDTIVWRRAYKAHRK